MLTVFEENVSVLLVQPSFLETLFGYLTLVTV